MTLARLLMSARLLAPGLLLAITGCSVVSGTSLPTAAPASAVSRAVEQGGRFLAFVGPHRQHAPPFLGVPGTNFWALRSWLDMKSGQRVHQLYVEDSYNGAQRNWDAARTAQGEALKFIPISKNEITCTNGCSYAEEFSAGLPEALLRASAASGRGVTVVFTAKSGATMSIAVPATMIEKQLAAVDAARAERPAAARSGRPAAGPPVNSPVSPPVSPSSS